MLLCVGGYKRVTYSDYLLMCCCKILESFYLENSFFSLPQKISKLVVLLIISLILAICGLVSVAIM